MSAISPAPPMMMVGVPRPDHLSEDQRRALTDWGFLGSEDSFREAWSLPQGWSIKTAVAAIGGYGSYSDHVYEVSDPHGRIRFTVSEKRNPAGIRTELDVVTPPTYHYTKERLTLTTGDRIEYAVHRSLDELSAYDLSPAYFDHHNLHRTLESPDVLVEIRRQRARDDVY